MIMGFFSTIGSGFKKAYDWVFQDEEKLRKVKSGNYAAAETEEEHHDEVKEFTERYDAWEEIDNIRMNFFLGSWATKKFKGGIIGEEKVKRELEELERKRAEEEGRPYDTTLQKQLEKAEQERRDKKRRQEEKQTK
jgi:hypothetical protein